MPLEKELKYQLKLEDYLKLTRGLKKRSKDKCHLLNYYFDNPKLILRQNKIGLRVRIIDGNKGLLTLKYPAKNPESAPRALKVRYEHEQKIPYKLAKSLLSGKCQMSEVDLPPLRILQKLLSKESMDGIEVLGAIETYRTHVPLKEHGFELEIDRCRIFNKRFYELEVETERPEKVDRAIRELLKEFEIPYHPLELSKLGRFIKEWKKRQ